MFERFFRVVTVCLLVVLTLLAVGVLWEIDGLRNEVKAIKSTQTQQVQVQGTAKVPTLKEPIFQEIIFETKSDFLRDAAKEFDKNYGKRAGWAQPFGYGTLTFSYQDPIATQIVLNRKIEWFAYCDTDAYFRIVFSDKLPSRAGIESKIIHHKDKKGRFWKSDILQTQTPGQCWWIVGLSDCWIDNLKEDKEGHRQVDNRSMMDQAVKEFKDVIDLNLQVVEYLW